MNREEAIITLTNTASLLRDGTRYMKPEHEKQFREAYEMAIKALKQPEPCVDTIDALHDEIVRRRIDEDTNDDGTLDEFDTEAILRRLPSAHKTGKWIYKNDLKQFFCSECGYPSLTYDDTYIYGMDLPNYCEDCGADMREGQDDSI